MKWKKYLYNKNAGNCYSVVFAPVQGHEELPFQYWPPRFFMAFLSERNAMFSQKRCPEEYAAQHNYSNCVHYTDDGWSGGNFERPDWKRLTADIEARRVSHALVTDCQFMQSGFCSFINIRIDSAPESDYNVSVSDTNTI